MIIKINKSITLSVLLGVMHLGAVAGLAFSGLALWLWLPGVAILGLMGMRLIRLYGLRNHPASVVALEVTDDGIAVSCTGHDEDYLACRLDDSFVSPWAVVLWLSDEDDTNYSLPILNDACHADDFRRLRAHLMAYSTPSET